MKTQALVLAEVKAPFVLQDVELDEPQPNEVLVKLVATGVCHTDLAIQQGQFPSTFPSIVGHEGAGTVLAVGSSVLRVKPGDDVLLSFAYCQTCHYCATGQPAGCQTFVERNFGRERLEGPSGTARGEGGEDIQGTFFGQSSFARHALVQESSCVKVPPGTDLITLAPLGCGLQTGAGCIFNILKPKASETVAIFGLGAVGCAALFASAALNLSKIIVVDLVDARLEFAKTAGATHTINGKDVDIIDQIRAITGGLGVQYSIEATGNTRVLRTAWEALRNFGTVCSIGTPGPGVAPPFDIHDHLNASKRYIGVAEGDSNPPEFIPFLMKLYEEGKFPVDKISKTFKFEDFEDALHAMHTGEVIKPVIIF